MLCDSTDNEVPRIVKYVEVGRLEVTRVWGWGEEELFLLSNGDSVSVWDNEKVLEIVVMVAQHFVYNKIRKKNL